MSDWLRADDYRTLEQVFASPDFTRELPPETLAAEPALLATAAVAPERPRQPCIHHSDDRCATVPSRRCAPPAPQCRWWEHSSSAVVRSAFRWRPHRTHTGRAERSITRRFPAGWISIARAGRGRGGQQRRRQRERSRGRRRRRALVAGRWERGLRRSGCGGRGGTARKLGVRHLPGTGTGTGTDTDTDTGTDHDDDDAAAHDDHDRADAASSRRSFRRSRTTARGNGNGNGGGQRRRATAAATAAGKATGTATAGAATTEVATEAQNDGHGQGGDGARPRAGRRHGDGGAATGAMVTATATEAATDPSAADRPGGESEP